MPRALSVSYVQSGKQNPPVHNGKVPEAVFEMPLHLETPEQVKAIYMTACVAGTPGFREELMQIAKETEVNSIVIDIKDFTGGISFTTSNPKLAPYISDRCGARDMKEFVEKLHALGIYVIGRITVFQDPLYAKANPGLAVQKASDRSVWEDYKGINFVDVSAKPFWEYIVELSKESHKLGFDELNFDYIRFPSDGPMKDIYFPASNGYLVKDPENGKVVALEKFFEYLHAELNEKEGIITSADLFGMTTTNTDDLNIGQVWESALPYFDYLAPMVYPSHYPKNFNGWANPNDHIYDLTKFVMQAAVDRTLAFSRATTTPQKWQGKFSADNIRTWIQDFDYGGDYDVVEVKAEIQASYDAGVKSWMVWSPSNRYTTGALQKE